MAQPDVMPEIEKVLKEGQRSMTLPEFLDLLGLDGTTYKSTQKIKGVESFRFSKRTPYNKVSFSTNWFDFDFMTDTRDKILFSSVELLGVKDEEQKTFTQIHTDFEAFIEAHEQFYNTSIDITDALMLPIEDFVFEIDESNDLCKQMLFFVKNKDTESLGKWLKSMNSTVQTFAVVGFELMTLRDKNIKPTKEQSKYISHIKTLENEIPFRSSFDINTEISIKDALTASYIETYWYLIKESTVLKD